MRQPMILGPRCLSQPDTSARWFADDGAVLLTMREMCGLWAAKGGGRSACVIPSNMRHERVNRHADGRMDSVHGDHHFKRVIIYSGQTPEPRGAMLCRFCALVCVGPARRGCNKKKVLAMMTCLETPSFLLRPNFFRLQEKTPQAPVNTGFFVTISTV